MRIEDATTTGTRFKTQLHQLMMTHATQQASTMTLYHPPATSPPPHMVNIPHIIAEATQVTTQAATKAAMEAIYGAHASSSPRKHGEKSIDSQTQSREMDMRFESTDMDNDHGE